MSETIGGLSAAEEEYTGQILMKILALRTCSKRGSPAKGKYRLRIGWNDEMAHKHQLSLRFARHAEADRRVRSVHAMVEAILSLSDEVLPKHKKRLLNSCLWQLTEAEGNCKYDLRFASRSAYKQMKVGKKDGLRHEHVYPRKKMVSVLLSATADEIPKILRMACGCVVTIEEHVALGDTDAGVDGWERYKSAQIEVWDRQEDREASLDDLNIASKLN